jgi:WD40 repeat protein
VLVRSVHVSLLWETASGGDDMSVRLWDTANGSLVETLHGHDGQGLCECHPNFPNPECPVAGHAGSINAGKFLCLAQRLPDFGAAHRGECTDSICWRWRAVAFTADGPPVGAPLMFAAAGSDRRLTQWEFVLAPGEAQSLPTEFTGARVSGRRESVCTSSVTALACGRDAMEVTRRLAFAMGTSERLGERSSPHPCNRTHAALLRRVLRTVVLQ